MRIAAISCLLLTSLVAAPAAWSLTDLPGRLRSTHGDWRVHCQSSGSGQTEACVALTAVDAPGDHDAGMTVIILRSLDRRQLLLRVFAPLGILLHGKYGALPIAVDGKNAGTIEIIRCMPKGCVGELLMPPSLLGKLKRGRSATFTTYQTPDERISFNISLSGLTAAVGALP